jgi:hypothetical protein
MGPRQVGIKLVFCIKASMDYLLREKKGLYYYHPKLEFSSTLQSGPI